MRLGFVMIATLLCGRLGAQRGDIGPRFVELVELVGDFEEFAVELHRVAAGVGLGCFHLRDDFLVAHFQRGDLALELLEVRLRFLARGGDGLALLGFLALLLLRLARRGAGRLRCGGLRSGSRFA